MALSIKGGSLMESVFIRLGAREVTCQRTAFMGGRKKFAYEDIDYVLMSEDGLLSIYSGLEVFSIPTKPGQPKHRLVIEALIDRVRGGHQTQGGGR
jgi:hypothetical protein